MSGRALREQPRQRLRAVLVGAIGWVCLMNGSCDPPGAPDSALAPPSAAGGAGAPRPASGLGLAPAPVSPAAAEAAPEAALPAAPRVLEWTFPRGPFGRTDVVISIPEAAPEQRFPVLVAFHGRGESVKGSRAGARGWLDDYALGRALSRLHAPPLSPEDFESFVTRERLERLNRGLAAQPFGGVIVVCPYLPDVLQGARAFAEARPLADFVVDVLLPRVYQKTPAIGTPAATGVDGVSLGGRAALLVGFTRPAAFGSVGALQAALDLKELSRFTELAARAVGENPGLVVRLLTSDEDYFRDVNQELSRRLGARGVAHELSTVSGTHSYRFNRGPGAIEMLLFHDRVLRSAAAL